MKSVKGLIYLLIIVTNCLSYAYSWEDDFHKYNYEKEIEALSGYVIKKNNSVNSETIKSISS